MFTFQICLGFSKLFSILQFVCYFKNCSPFQNLFGFLEKHEWFVWIFQNCSLLQILFSRFKKWPCFCKTVLASKFDSSIFKFLLKIEETKNWKYVILQNCSGVQKNVGSCRAHMLVQCVVCRIHTVTERHPLACIFFMRELH